MCAATGLGWQAGGFRMYRLIYKSRSTRKIDWNLVNEIIRSSEAGNVEEGITGVLLATDTHFLQVIEGDFEQINRVFLRIARDPRHEEIQLISFGCVEGRLFGGWAMHGIGIFDFNRELMADLIGQYGGEDGRFRFPIEEWKVLSLISDLRVAA
jgi:hypothetical protein